MFQEFSQNCHLSGSFGMIIALFSVIRNVNCRFPKKLLTFHLKVDIMIWQIDASVAQSVVHLTRNEKVACSSQVTSSKRS